LSYSTKKTTRRTGIINIDHKQYPELHTYITRYNPALEQERKIKVPDNPNPLGWQRANKKANMKNTKIGVS
jgi:uncharacterized protein YijF (DUF1287 family)